MPFGDRDTLAFGAQDQPAATPAFGGTDPAAFGRQDAPAFAAPAPPVATPPLSAPAPIPEPVRPRLMIEEPGAVERGFVSGLLEQNPAMMGASMEAFSYLTENEDIRTSLGDASKELAGFAKLRPEEYAPKAQGLFESENFGQAMTAIGEMFGQGVASTVPSLITGTAGAVGGARVGGRVGGMMGGAVGAMGPAYMLNTGEVYQALKDENVKPARAAEWAAYIAGPAMTALDVVSLGPIINRLGGVAKVRNELARSIARRVAAEAAKGVGREGVTEAIQEAVKEATISLETGKPFWTVETAERMAESAIAGALVGGAMGMGAGIRADRPAPTTPPGEVPEGAAPAEAVIGEEFGAADQPAFEPPAQPAAAAEVESVVQPAPTGPSAAVEFGAADEAAFVAPDLATAGMPLGAPESAAEAQVSPEAPTLRTEAAPPATAEPRPEAMPSEVEGAVSREAEIAPVPVSTQADLARVVGDTDVSLTPAAVARELNVDEAIARRALDQAAAQGTLIRKTSTGYRRKPRRRGPVDVLTFLADRGGIRDTEGHDLAKGRGAPQLIPGVGALIRPQGLSVDAAGELLHEAGYFGPPATTDRPTEAQVLELLDRGFAGEKVYIAEEQPAPTLAAVTEENQRQIQAAIDEIGVNLAEAEQARVRDMVAEGMDVADAIERAAIEGEEAITEQILEAQPDLRDIPSQEIVDEPRAALPDTGEVVAAAQPAPERVPEAEARERARGPKPREVGPERREEAEPAAAERPLYASRPVTNADELIAWAASQGFKTTLPASDMHVTIAFSREPVAWDAAGDTDPSISLAKSDARSVEQLGDEGAVVLRFSSPELSRRWGEYRKAGASWDFPGYKPHITLTYEPGDVDLSKVEPYTGPIKLGAERQEPVDDDAGRDVKEVATPVPLRPARAPAAPVTEVTPEGEQRVIPGAERITEREEAERRMAERKRPTKPQKEPDERLFDVTSRGQEEMFALRGPTLWTQTEEFAGGRVEVRYLFTEKFANDREATAADVRRELNRLGLRDVGVRIADAITATIDRRAAGQILGRYSRGLIDVALDGGASIRTARHEAIHAMRDLGLFTDEEWAALSAQSNKTWRPQYNIDKLYKEWSDSARTEEGIAHAFSDYDAGKLKATGPMRRAFEKIKALLRALARALKRRGFLHVNDVFGRIESGEVGGRHRRKRYGGMRFHASQEEAQRTADFEEEASGFTYYVRSQGEGKARRWIAGHQNVHATDLIRAGVPIKELSKAQQAYLRKHGVEDQLEIDFGKEVPRFSAAYHGSPHDFEQFTTDKIGTGEGAQVYGWGLYFAGKKEVAEYYREALSGGERVLRLDKRPLGTLYSEQTVGALAYEAKISKVQARHFINYLADNPNRTVAGAIDSLKTRAMSDDPHVRREANQAVNRLTELGPRLRASTKGKLYQVELQPREEEYLDWDRDLSEQSQGVREKIDSIPFKGGRMPRDRAGRAIYWDVGLGIKQGMFGKEFLPKDESAGDIMKAASQYLASIGIPGVKYLDQLSRVEGEGTYNYVIFDDELVTIEAKFSIRPDTPDSSDTRAAATQGWLAKGQPIDRAMRMPFDWFGGVDDKGEWQPGRKVYDKAAKIITESRFKETGPFRWMNAPLEAARAGLIDRYGLAPEYVAVERKRDLEERRIALQGADILKTLAEQKVGIEEAQVLQAILTGEKVDDAAMGKLAVPIRQAIDELGQEAVSLGLLSAESYERNRGAYLHRVYMKHEADQPALSRWANRFMGNKRKKILGDALKGRGIFLEVEAGRLMRDIPSFAEARRGLPRKGEFFTILDKVTDADTLTGIDPAPAKVERRVYWPADEPIPDRYADYTARGVWEIRGKPGKKVTLWRDYTKAERENMGEIQDARYTIGKTFMLMSHDLATGRFYKDIAENEEWTVSKPPAGNWVEASEFRRLWADESIEWVKVPTSAIPDTGGKKRWGALAGTWVRAEIWRDLNELDIMGQPNFWSRMLTQWKLNKTARSPVVHMNNVMSNFTFMDLADVRLQDLVRGIRAYATNSADFQEAAANGAFGADLISQEIRREVLLPVLEEIERDMKRAAPGPATSMRVLGRIAEAIWSRTKAADRKLVELYRLEDEVFRMGMYMRRRSLGESAEDAALEARQQFLDYDIRAPWVNLARRTVLPFLAYTYRAAPLIARSVATRPWKLAKYFTIAYAANLLAYMMAPGDEEEERRSIRREEQGYTWIGVPRMLRMPYRDAFGNPVFLDIRRWIPAGDIFDIAQGHGVFQMPAPLGFGGPLMLGMELSFNKSAFTGEPIIDELTATPRDRAEQTASYLWKAWMPSAAWIPGSWYWNKIGLSARGAVDSSGRPYPLPEAVASSFGIKLKPQDVGENMRWRLHELNKARRALRAEERRLGRLRGRNVISEDTFRSGIDGIDRRRERIDERERELTGQ